MFELARLELRWLTRPSRLSLVRAIRGALRREGLVDTARASGDPSGEPAFVAQHADRILAARIACEARELERCATVSFRRRYGDLVTEVRVVVRPAP